MVQNQAMTCLQNDGGIFSVSPHSKFNYKDACGTFRTSAVHALTNYTFVIRENPIVLSIKHKDNLYGF